VQVVPPARPLTHRTAWWPRDTYADIDTFHAATSRHLASVEAVLIRQVRRTVPDARPVL
jgi:hypothetical protein